MTSPQPSSQAQTYRQMLLASGAIKVANGSGDRFRLRSGGESRVYVDHAELLCEPKGNTALVRALTDHISSTFGRNEVVLVNVDSKSSPHLTGAVATIGEYRQIVILPESTYHAERGPNLRLRMPTCLDEKDCFVIIDDVLTPNDTTALGVADMVETEVDRRLGSAQGLNLHLVVGLVRNPTAACPPLERRGITVHWVTTLDELMGDIWTQLEKEQREGLQDESIQPYCRVPEYPNQE